MVKAGELALGLEKGRVHPEHHKASITCRERAESLSRAATPTEAAIEAVETPSIFDILGILVSLLHASLGLFFGLSLLRVLPNYTETILSLTASRYRQQHRHSKDFDHTRSLSHQQTHCLLVV